MNTEQTRKNTALTIATQLAQSLNGWEVETIKGWDDNACIDRCHMVNKKKDLSFLIRNERNGKLEISFSYPPSIPRRAQSMRPSYGMPTYPQIGCSSSKAVKAIQKDIERRLLPDLEEYTKAYKVEYAKHCRYEEESRKVKEWIDKNYSKAPSGFRLSANGNTIHFSAYLSIEQAEAVLNLSQFL